MQESGNTALAAAITAGFAAHRALVEVDWGGNNTYGHAYSDVSEVVTQVQVQREFAGDIPDEVSIIEGHSSAQLDLTLGGTRAGDDLSVCMLLDPYNVASPLYSTLKLGKRIKFSTITDTDTGSVTILQFTGRIRTIDVRADGTVQIKGADYAELLRKAVNVRPWAVDAAGQRGDYPDHVQIVYQGWVLDHVLRQCGIYESPPPIEDLARSLGYPDGAVTSLFAATLRGGWIAEVGDTGGLLRAVDVPAVDMWTEGAYTIAANGTATDYSSHDYLTAFATPWPDQWSVAMGAHVAGPRTTLNGSTIIVLATMNNGLSTMRLTLSDAGVLSSRLTGTGGYNATFTGPTVSPNAWHYVGVALRRNGASGMVATFRVDGVDTTVSNATVYPAFGATGTQDYLVVESGMPVEMIQMWVVQQGVTYIWPDDRITSANDLEAGSNLDRGYGLTRLPDIYQQEAWDVLRSIVSAHHGILRVGEDGQIRFDDRWRPAVYSSFDDKTIDGSGLTDITLTDLADGVRNRYAWEVVQGAAWKDQSVFRADKDLQFDSAPSATTDFLVGIEDAQVIGIHSLSLVSPWPTDDDEQASGFYVLERGTANLAPGVTVGITPMDQRTLRIRVVNPNAFWVRFTSSTGQPALRIAGTKVIDDLPRVGGIQHDGSIEQYAERVFEITAGEWRSYYESVEALASIELDATHSSIPTISRIPAVGDPRLQLGDSVLLDDPARLGRMIGIIAGIVRTLTDDGGLTDDLTIRLIHPHGVWLLGDEAYSLLGDTTILN